MPKIVQIMSIEIEIHFLNSSHIYLCHLFLKTTTAIVNIAMENQVLYKTRTQITGPLGARTLQIQGFELDQKKFEIPYFLI